jgi:D-alanyl-D-alanine carboxypeptidase/D-alanyl-D-alanine-endopeptidase (penicillin-binding protein 4)
VKKRLFSVLLSLLIALFSGHFNRQATQAACLSFSDLIQNGGYAVADPAGSIISACDPDAPFVPASIVKIPTALAAFHILGREYRFQTALYMDRQDNLYIKGYGDPFLVSEEVEIILGRLRERGVNRINNIFVDTSSFALSSPLPGRGKSDNPYDSPVTAVGVNFNTISFRVDDHGRVTSAEPQTPTLPIMTELGKGFREGEYRVNICREGCRPEVRSARYAVELFRGIQRKMGIPGDGNSGRGDVPEDADLVYVHDNTRTLEDVVSSLLEYSNNFVANLVYLACGAQKYGYPATWEKAGQAAREALNRVIGARAAGMMHLKEGSGLSRHNRVTARSMVQVLVAFKPFMHLLQEKKGAAIKSGTLKGVYNYAGYLQDGSPFVIMLNQEKNTRDDVLRRLQQLSLTGKDLAR